MLKKTKRKIVTSAIISSCSLAIIAGVGGFVFFTGLADADYSKGLAFTAKGMVRYGFTKKADFVTSDHSINPIYPTKAMESLNYSVKDACIVEKDGKFYLYSSAFYEENERTFPHVIGAVGDTLSSIQAPFLSWSGLEQRFLGLASPDIVKNGDTYYMVYNSWGDKKGEPNQLFYATSPDLINWEAQLPLAKNLTEGVRVIDAAVMFFNDKVYLVYKEKQMMKFAVATSIDGHFTAIENNVYGWYENCQFLNIENEIYLLGTNRRHLPILLKMQGDPKQDNSWGSFSPVLALTPPKQGFNTNNIANAAGIFVYDGEYYLLYAGRTQSKTHIGRGNNKLGVAKSTDLHNWVVF